jgi:hypothetical protein
MRALTTPSALGCWMQAHIDFAPNPERRFRVDGTTRIPRRDRQVLDVNPGRRLSFPGSKADGFDSGGDRGLPSQDGSRVTLRHRLPAGRVDGVRPCSG